MKFDNEADKLKFIKGEQYYKGTQNYCLGKSLEEAGQIISNILKDMASKETKGD